MMQKYHVMVVAKLNDQTMSQVYSIGPGWKRTVRKIAEEDFRSEFDIPSSTKLRFKMLFSGSKEDADTFYTLLMRKLDDGETDITEVDLTREKNETDS